MKKSFEANGKAQDFNVKVLIADNDVAKQLSQIQTFVEQKVDAVMTLNCVASRSVRGERQAAEHGEDPGVYYQHSGRSGRCKQAGASVVQSVQTDQKMGKQYIGEQLVKDLGPNGSAVVGIVGDDRRRRQPA